MASPDVISAPPVTALASMSVAVTGGTATGGGSSGPGGGGGAAAADSVSAPPMRVVATLAAAAAAGRDVVAAPSMLVPVAAGAPAVTGGIDLVAAPPLAVRAALRAPTVSAGTRVLAVAAAPADVGVDAPAPTTVSGTVTLLSPVAVAVAGTPAFTVTVDTDTSGQRIEAQYDTGAAFAAAVSVYADAPAGMPAQVTATAGNVADGVWWWRARLIGPAGAGAWTDPAAFAVNSLEGQAVAAGSYTIDPRTAAATHLWFIDHDQSGTDAGGTAVVVGTGFGAAPQVLLGDTACTVLEVSTVPATGSTGPQITPGVVCDPWHQRITFTIPAVDPDGNGDALSVIGGD